MRIRREKKVTMEMAINDPKNRGYHIIVIGGRLFKARTGEAASKILDQARKKYPKKIPSYTYLPDADSLILRNEIPPLMGRHLFLETFEALFSSNFILTFSTKS
jgi:hypothetical protein